MKVSSIEALAERLKELRQDKNLSLRELSKQVGIGSASLNRWENCKADIKGSQLVLLAEYFGVTTDYLLGLED